jgi:hypothetical protein
MKTVVLKCTKKDVHDKVPDVRAGDIALSDTGTWKEEGSVFAEGPGVVKKARIFALFPDGKGKGSSDDGWSFVIEELKEVNVFEREASAA